jgi:hypothetical protein
MAVYRYATKDLSINNAKAFISALNATDASTTKNSTVLYAVIGGVYPYTNEPTPINPPDNEQYLQYEAHRKFIGAKKIATNNVSHVVPRYDWTSGTVYSMYRDTDQDMYDRAYYVLTDEYNVYKCLYNNKGGTSTVKPTGYSISKFTTSDGYVWKYMYTITLGEAQKFLTPNYMPVKTLTSSDSSVEGSRQWAVQQAAVNGAIEIVETVNLGSNYIQIANGVVETGGRTTIRLSKTSGEIASPLDNIYNGSSVYIISGTGSGQLRRIINYEGNSKTLTVNTAFATTPNTDSKVIISPTVTIIGDGTGAKAYSRVNTVTGAISNVSIISAGSSYTRAQALITSNTINGTGATANVVISPVGGHGSDPVRELAGDKLLLNVTFNGSEGVSATGAGYIPSNTVFRNVSVLKDPVLKVNSNNVLQSVEAIANTSNSPSTLRLTTRLVVSYEQMDAGEPTNPLAVRNIITNKRVLERGKTGELEFVTATNSIERNNQALSNAVKAANANIVYIRDDESSTDPSFYTVYINNVDSYGDYAAFVKNDVILKSTSETEVAVVKSLAGPEANTFSGEVLYTENVEVVSRDPDQQEDIKIILDF